MTATSPSSSLVTYTTLPSGRSVTPSGSSPTLAVATTFPAFRSTTLTWAASSLATNSRVPSALTSSCSGSLPAGITRVRRFVPVSPSPMPSAERSGGGSLLSSTPGGALGEPLSATYKYRPSGLTLMPRGRFPTITVATTVCEAVSMTLMSPDASFVTYTREPDVLRAPGAFEAGSRLQAIAVTRSSAVTLTESTVTFAHCSLDMFITQDHFFALHFLRSLAPGPPPPRKLTPFGFAQGVLSGSRSTLMLALGFAWPRARMAGAAVAGKDHQPAEEGRRQ